MTEIESLAARSAKYLRSAALLLDIGDYESSVSRSYYAMFYCVQALLLTKGLTVSSHAGLNTVFSEQFVKTGLLPKQMSRELNRAFEKRQLGDYESQADGQPVARHRAAHVINQVAIVFHVPKQKSTKGNFPLR